MKPITPQPGIRSSGNSTTRLDNAQGWHGLRGPRYRRVASRSLKDLGLPEKHDILSEARENVIKAIVQGKYGTPDVLQLKDIEKPVVKADEVLVHVHAAAVNIGDWHLLRGMPYAMRAVSGLLKPKCEVPGLDIAGQVEAVGADVKQVRPGDQVFGWCKGAFAEYACAAEDNLLPKPASLTLEQSAAVGDSAFTALAAVRDQGKVQPGHSAASCRVRPRKLSR
jgi:D-arabinose 1-dehydrogenase-like Zn-dependent alcohol dehydrogenase